MALLTGLINNSDILAASDFLIVDALSKRPMTTREIAHSIQISQKSILTRLRRYEEKGLVVQRAKDRRWQTIVVLRAETSQETFKVPGTNVYPPLPSSAPTPPPKVPDTTPFQPPPKAYAPKPPRQEVSPRALDISKRMNVPPFSKGYGEVGMGKLGACERCKKATPLKYGTFSVCPICAREKEGK